ncbi:hypothetical protein HJG60_009215 [Phyllostomus discolor]|uniref:Uncharacterized protein n=1 Tax=Phyllostomus discolor TaxID=89673 RepID=A0A834DFW5_9CHIR|nr:hypothetical protein HJG60_009215 [Phyllostomus discolor]
MVRGGGEAGRCRQVLRRGTRFVLPDVNLSGSTCLRGPRGHAPRGQGYPVSTAHLALLSFHLGGQGAAPRAGGVFTVKPLAALRAEEPGWRAGSNSNPALQLLGDHGILGRGSGHCLSGQERQLLHVLPV